MVPFQVGKDAGNAAYRSWLHSRWFAPSDLKHRAEHDGLDGVYVPYWTYDSDSLTHYRGARGTYYYTTESYKDSQGRRRTKQVRHTRWRSASGTVSLRFDDVQVCASTGLPRNRMAQLEPWDLGGLRPFDGAYLAGFVAERYSLDLEDGWGQAQQIMEGRIASAVRRDIGGDEQRVHSMDVHHRGVTFKHVLLPTWVSSFRYRGKVYRVVVNAQTGEVAGDRPWSVWKIVLFTLLCLAVVATITFFVWRAREPAPPAPPDSIELPAGVASEGAISLNHAFTLLSEVYEPWRKAHTGSVYERFYYLESDGKWYPLALLRDAGIAQQEQKIAKDLWASFLARCKAR